MIINYDVNKRLATQFKNKENLTSILKSLGDDGIDESLDDLLNKRSIETSTGFSLDVIGNIVGVIRPYGYDDERYRSIIKTKIFINNSNATVDSVLSILSMIADADIRYLCNKSLNPIYEINANPQFYDKESIRNLQTTLGIEVRYTCNDKDNAFGFAEDYTALTFGDINNEDVGGNLPFLL